MAQILVGKAATSETVALEFELALTLGDDFEVITGRDISNGPP